MNASRMDLHSFSRTPFCRMMAKILVALMVFQTFPLWELSRSHQWSPEEFSRTVHGMMQLLGPGEAQAAAPVADAGGDRSLVKNRPGGSSVLLDGLASFDPDGDPLTYQWYGPFVTTSGATPAVIIPEGTYSVSLAVDDGTGRSPVDTATLAITPCFGLTARAKSGKVQLVWTHQPGTERYDIFRAGEAAPQTLQKIGETTSTYSTYLDATVVNETTYVYVVAAVNAGAACYSGFAGAHPTASRTAANHAPVITSSPVTVGTVGIPYNYQVLATDPNGDTLHYSLNAAPAGMTLGPADGLISWVPIEKGAFEVVVRVDDGRGKEASQTFTVTVVEVAIPNRAPIANAGPDQTVPVGSTPMLDGSKATDADGDPLTYSWTLLSTPAGSTAALSDPAAMKPTFFVDKPGIYVAQLIVNDGKVDSAPDEVVISTENSKPVAEAGPDQTALVGATVNLDGSQSSDVDGDPLTLAWTLMAVPSGSTAQLSDPAVVKPALIIDRPGTYVVQLVVNDGTLDSDPDSVTILTENSKPVANAGPDQTAHVGETVTLDGSKSSDVDGNPLTFKWALIGQPAGSLAQLSSPAAVKPELSIDKPGTYVAQLTVNDGTVDSDPDTVTIITENSKPVADAGPDQTAHVGDTVTLDGSKSSDVDGDLLTHKWSLTIVPAGSGAALSDPAAVKPQFSIDKPGTYVAQLIVNDGTVDSDADTVTILTENSRPAANAGPAQTARVGDKVTLDGRGSSDVDGDPLIFKWSLTAVPTGSAAALSDPAAQQPTFFVDKPGTYVAQLIVNDGMMDSAPATVTISTINSKPAADAGPDQTVSVHETVLLDGTGSSDADFDPLTYLWSFTTRPVGSSAAFSSATASQPSFEADSEGTYVAQLIVNDGKESSTPDTVTITANLRMVTVPNVVGMTQANAEAAIVAANLAVGTVTTANSSTVPAGSVISQDPAAAASVPEGSPVALVVSLGPVMVTVPNVVGMTQANAEAAIVAASLAVGTITTANSSTVPAGSIISQDPAAAASVPEGIPVALVVSLGPVMVNVPNVVGMTQANAEAAIIAASLAVGTITTANSNTVPAGSVISQDPTAGTSVLTGSSVDFVISSGPPIVGDYIRPEVTVTVSPSSVNVGETVTISVTTNDNVGVTSKSLTVNGAPVSLDPMGSATFTSAVAGVFTAVGTASDAAGNVGSSGMEFVFLAAGDTTGPVAAITSPSDNAKLSVPTDIIGTASDANLIQYKLEYSVKDKNEFMAFATGTASVTNGVLGKLDATKMRNGLYDVRLTVVDASGNITSTMKTYELEGEMKVGNFTVAFNDLTVPMAGMPITIIRMYDSRMKSKGDFGFGWTLGLKNIEINVSGVLGSDWQQVVAGSWYGLPTYKLSETKAHTITITYPDGKVDEFSVAVNPSTQMFIPLSTTSLSFVPKAGTTSSLTSLDVSPIDLWIQPEVGNVELIEFSGWWPFDPQRFQLTAADGTIYILNRQTGLESIQDTNGNTITFTANGIIHSAGKSVLFSRDAQGRITTITDPMGNTLQYAYDFYGDLISMTDQLGNTTQYTYNSTHGLVDIIDPRGIRGIRNEYDVEGNLIAHIDAEGNKVEYTHNIAARQEIVKDRLGNLTVFEYDTKGYVVAKTDALGNRTAFTYDANGNKLSEIDPLGNTTSFTYDATNNLLTRTDALGNTTSYTYNAQGKALTITDPMGHVTTNTYDVRGNLLTTIDPLGNVTSSTYDGAGHVITTTDAVAHTTSYQYDVYGNRMRQTDALGNVTTFTYDANGNKLTETDPRGGVTTYGYDAAGRQISVQNALGNITQTEYDAAGNRIAAVDSLGNRTAFVYDAANRLVRINYPDGTSVQNGYDAEGNRISTTDQQGNVTTYQYNANKQLLKVTYSDGATQSYGYDAAGRQTSITDALGNTTARTYDAAGRNLSTTDPNGNSTSFAYNANGNMVSQTNANGNTTTFDYDLAGRLVRTTLPGGQATVVAYDAMGRKVSETDAAGNTTQFAYDAKGNLISVTDALGGITQYEYDANNNHTKIIDANGHETSFSYDVTNRLLTKTMPNGGTEAYTYDAAGRQIAKTDAKGQTIQFAYDTVGRLTSRTYPDASSVQFTYTASGKRATAVDQRGTTSYDYDVRNRLTQLTYPDGQTIGYAYDLTSRLETVSSLAGTISYIYNNSGRLQEVHDPLGNITSFAYDPAGNRTGLSYPNGTTTAYTYDINSRLTQLTHKNSLSSGFASYAYTLGPLGNRTRIDESTGIVRQYTYDALYRLTKEQVTDPTDVQTYQNDYSYDPVGNRLNKTHTPLAQPVVSTHYTYNAADQLLIENGNTYTYDLNGNLSTKTDATGTTTYTYDFDNKLVRVEKASGTVDYVYDTEGNRVETVAGTETTRYLVDTNRALAQVLVEYTPAGSIVASYVYADDLISMRRGSETYYYHFDGLGSTRLLTHRTGVVTDTYDYDAFGNVIASVGTTQNEFLFTGQQYDANIGFYYLRARYYQPTIGRFTISDPFEGDPYAPMSLHKYLYAVNDPVNRFDPSGYFSLTELMVTSAISGILNAIPAVMAGDSIGAVLQRLAIGAVEGAALYTAGLFAFKYLGRLGKWLYSIHAERAAESVFNRLARSGPLWPGLSLPRYFSLTTKLGEEFWFTVNATEHLAEQLIRLGVPGTTKFTSALMIQKAETVLTDVVLKEAGGNLSSIVGKRLILDVGGVTWEVVIEENINQGMVRWVVTHFLAKGGIL